MFKKRGIPLYIQLKDKLQEDIKQNYKVGDSIPTEQQIEEFYKVSRITVRKALEELQRDNIIEKKQGKGTFVKESQILYDANSIGSLTQRLEKQNIQLKTKSIIYELIEGEHPVKELLECDKLLCISRLRVLNNTPFAYMKNYIDYTRVPNIQEEFTIESLYTFFKNRYKIEFYNAKETVEAKVSDKELAKFLEIEEKFPLLALKRLSYDKFNRPLEYSDIVIKGDMYIHQINLENEILSNY